MQGSVLDVVADKMLGSAAGNIMGVVSIVSLLASVSANIFAGPRVYYAMARDGVFLPAAARIHPTYRTPAAAIVAQAIWASILIMSGSADTLTTYTGFAVTLFATIASQRCSCCARASRTPTVLQGAGVIRTRPPCS